MTLLILGLTLFISIHSIRIGADEWRNTQIVRFRKAIWKLGYSIVSIVGIMLMILGFGMAKQDPIFLWTPPAGMLHLTALFVLIAFILIAAAYVPRNHIRARLHHPMILGVQAWAFGHLLANDTLADVILFGSFLIWASLSFKAARQRDQINGVSYGLGSITGTSISIIVGFIMWLAFVLKLHAMLIGIPLFM